MTSNFGECRGGKWCHLATLNQWRQGQGLYQVSTSSLYQSFCGHLSLRSHTMRVAMGRALSEAQPPSLSIRPTSRAPEPWRNQQDGLKAWGLRGRLVCPHQTAYKKSPAGRNLGDTISSMALALHVPMVPGSSKARGC